MVHIVDEGSHFEVPVETIWRFLQSPEDHGRSHPDRRNMQMKVLGETSVQVSWEQEAQGKTVKVVNRVTTFPPLGMMIEQVEGPIAGSKFFNYYTPKGGRTGVTIVGDFHSPMVPEAQLEAVVRKNFAQVFAEDTAALQRFPGKK
jgi:hypothetical protein